MKENSSLRTLRRRRDSSPSDRSGNPVKRDQKFVRRFDVTYTYAEQTTKKYTIADALKGAAIVLEAKRIYSICVNAVGTRDRKTPITLVELNQLQTQIVEDSLIHSA